MTDAQLDALWADACQRDQPTRDMVRAFARAAIAAAHPQQPQVADLNANQINNLQSKNDAQVAAPAHPQQPAPLTSGAIARCMVEVSDPMLWGRMGDQCGVIAEQFVRAIERAHGIVPAPTTGEGQ
jgi:hypothetical protein